MQKKAILLALSVSTCLALGSLFTPARAATNANNSATNERLQSNQEMNAQDQGSSKSDIQTTSEIRNRLVKTNPMSVDAKNVKIITLNGMVTLKGPVKNRHEKLEIEKIAKQVAGADHVTNEIEIE